VADCPRKANSASGGQVCAAGLQREDRGTVTKQDKKTAGEEEGTKITENREKEQSKPKRQNNGVRYAEVLVGHGGGG
jgi:hypothetical protein